MSDKHLLKKVFGMIGTILNQIAIGLRKIPDSEEEKGAPIVRSVIELGIDKD